MYKIAVVPGDGIGQEVIAEGVKVLNALEETADVSFSLDYLDIGSERYLRTGELLTENDIDDLRKHDAIYFGAIGDPRVAPGILEKGILISMRTTFDQYVNTRPSKAWHPYTPLKEEKDFDIIFLRENTEDFYMGAGSRFSNGKGVSLDLKRKLYDAKITMNLHLRSE